MKKFLTSILAVIYLLAGSGLLMHQHYCMGELVEQKLSLLHVEDIHLCDKCGMEQQNSHGCCEQKTQLLKKNYDDQVKQEQQFTVSLVLSPALLPAIDNSGIVIFCPETPVVTIRSWQKPPPPELPLFLAYNNLRI